MKLVINTNKIDAEIKLLDKCIKEYNNNSYDIFNELSKLTSYWSGEESKIFLQKINDEKVQVLNVVDNLEELSRFYKKLSNYYEKMK